ncbi:MAG: esterase/lipase family protein [Sandaracinaceae bacterium]
MSPLRRVFLIHGMGRSATSLAFLAMRLRAAGYRASTFGYTVRDTPIEVIGDRFRVHIEGVVRRDGDEGGYAVVGHSLGNIITRLVSPTLPRGFRRFAMLAPPNRPPLLAAKLKEQPLFQVLTGDAGQRLADPSFYARLPIPDVPTVIFAGDAAKRLDFLPFDGAAADGIVSVEETRLPNVRHRVFPAWHTFIMNHPDVVKALLEFLGEGG